jgi:uncharacterized protein with gpF-like domain
MTGGEQILFEFAENLTKKGRLNTATGKQVERLLASYRNVTEQELTNFINALEPELRSEYKKAYYNYINGGYTKYHSGIKAYRIEDMKPAYRKEVENAVTNSLSLIKTQNKEYMNQLQNRFINWSSIPSNDMRGNSDNPEKIKSYLNKEILQIPENGYQTEAHKQFIITDQTRKLIGSMNDITAKNSGAFAFIWHNRRDKKVVGRPGGEYPIGTPSHDDHWDREGKLYLIKGSWAVTKGLVKKADGVIYDDDINDGMPSVPPGCRCYAEYFHDLELLPKKYEGIITAKGREYMGGE